MTSLEHRLQLGLLASLIPLLVLLLWGGGAAIRWVAESLVVERLEHDSDALLRSLRFDRFGTLHPRPQRLAPVYHQEGSGHYYVIQAGDAAPMPSRSLAGFALEVPKIEPGVTSTVELPGPEGQRLLARVENRPTRDLPVWITVAEDVSRLDKVIEGYQWVLSGAGALILLLLLGLQTLVVRRSLAPLAEVREDIQHFAEGTVERLSTAVPREILPLVEEFNRLLWILNQRLEHSRNSVGNLAHALKTPVNLLVQTIDHAGGGIAPDTERELEVQIERLRQLIERELHRARLAGSGSPTRRFNAKEDIFELVRVLRQMYQPKELEIEVGPLPGQPLAIDREDMLELLGNLLDNACKWAGRKVRLELFEGDPIVIRVDDDGPGVPEAELARLVERGTRIDEQRHGHGLGLSIALDIAKLYGGKLTFGRSESLGGLLACARIPPRSGESRPPPKPA